MSDREIMNAKRTAISGTFEKKDKYVQAVKEKFEQRSQTGIRKYNTTLERTDLSFLDWLEHLQEELMDATLYVERLKTSYVEENTKTGKGSLGE
jgi:hypothetical protein